jgi:hypothetical protein
MTDLRQAAIQALEVMKNIGYVPRKDGAHPVEKAFAALRAALEQPEQEPVGEVIDERGGVDYFSYVPPVGTALYTTPPAAQWDKPSASFDEWWDGDYDDLANPYHTGTPAYWAWAGWIAAQRPWVGLTDEEIFSVLGNLQRKYNGPPTEDSRVVFALAIEAKLKEKNT